MPKKITKVFIFIIFIIVAISGSYIHNHALYENLEEYYFKIKPKFLLASLILIVVFKLL